MVSWYTQISEQSQFKGHHTSTLDQQPVWVRSREIFNARGLGIEVFGGWVKTSQTRYKVIATVTLDGATLIVRHGLGNRN